MNSNLRLSTSTTQKQMCHLSELNDNLAVNHPIGEGKEENIISIELGY